jgi:hypothetical protein
MDLLGTVVCNHIVGIPSVAYVLNTCPRCQGKGYYGGISFDNLGNLNVVTDGALLQQEITKILTENMRPNGYGFNYSLLSSVVNPDSVNNAQNEAVRCLTFLYNLQQQEKANGVVYRNTEEISTIQNVAAFLDTTDPRRIFISADVTSVSGASVNTLVPLKG